VAAFAQAPAAPQPVAPDTAKAAFLQSLQETPAAPARQPDLTFQPAPVLKTCLSNCYSAYTTCKSGCGGDTICLGNCWDSYDACRCNCGSCR
jgi:hypothetical protein